MIKYITIVLTMTVAIYFLWAMVCGPGDWDASAAYTDTLEAPHGLVDVVPHFHGVEAMFSSESIHVTNEYGDVGLDINECWLDDYIGGIPAAPNALLDGVQHNDTVASVVNAGDLIIGTVAGWDDLPVGVNGDVLTLVGLMPVWQAPAGVAGVVRDMNEVAIDVTGPDWDAALALPAYSLFGVNASDIMVWVRYRVGNSQTMYNAISAPNPVADMVTYYWVENASNNLEVHVANDCQSEIYVTASYVEPI